MKTQAIARLYLDNIANIQSSWVTQGLKIGQLALFFGANDMGSLMIEENLVSQAGTVHHLTLEEIRNAIVEAGYIPRQRNVVYQLVDQCASGGCRKWGGSRPSFAAPRGNGKYHSCVMRDESVAEVARLPIEQQTLRRREAKSELWRVPLRDRREDEHA